MDMNQQSVISKIFKEEITDFSINLEKDYSISGGKYENISRKSNNFLISSLSKEIMIYSALMRSFDSSMGNRVEKIALKIAEASGWKVAQGVEGTLSTETVGLIAKLLDAYKDKSNPKVPEEKDLMLIQQSAVSTEGKSKFHNSDYLLEKEKDGIKYITLMELKAGGDLDNKKARSEKEAILEQYSILCSEHKKQLADKKVKISVFFGTIYNKDSLNEGKENWQQGSVKSFFANEELLIGKDFWNYICDSDEGWELIKKEYSSNSHLIEASLQKVINSF